MYKKLQSPSNSLSQMLTDPSLRKLCDVDFIVDSERFPAHGVVVAAASPVLANILTMRTGINPIHLKRADLWKRKNCWGIFA